MSHLLYVLSLIVFASAAFIGGAMWNDNFDRKFRITDQGDDRAAFGPYFYQKFHYPAKDKFEAEIMSACDEASKKVCQCIVDQTFARYTETQLAAIDAGTAPVAEAIEFLTFILSLEGVCEK